MSMMLGVYADDIIPPCLSYEMEHHTFMWNILHWISIQITAISI